MDVITTLVFQKCQENAGRTGCFWPPGTTPSQARVAIQVAGPCGIAYATYGNLADGDCRTFALLPAKRRWLRQGVQAKNQPWAIHPCDKSISAMMEVSMVGAIWIHAEEHPPCILMLGWPASIVQDTLTTPWVSRVASDLASELAGLLPAAIAELADEWLMLGFLPSGGWVPASNSLHLDVGGGDNNDAGPAGTSRAAGTSTAPFWKDKEADRTEKPIKLSPGAPARQDLRLCMGGLRFRDPSAERDYNTFSGMSQALTDIMTMLVAAVLCAACAITSESSAAQAAWFQANHPYGDIYCIIGIAYVPLLLPAVWARASWYLRNRQTILLIRVALMFLLSGALVVPHTAEPSSHLISTICINTLVSLPLIHGLEALGARTLKLMDLLEVFLGGTIILCSPCPTSAKALPHPRRSSPAYVTSLSFSLAVPVLLSLPLRLAILCLSIPAVPAACKHDAKGSWLSLPCTTFGVLFHVLILGIAPLAMHAWIERRERRQYVEAWQRASDNRSVLSGSQ